MAATPRERIVHALDRRIRARYPLIAVATSEERRFKHLINEVLQLRGYCQGNWWPGEWLDVRYSGV